MDLADTVELMLSTDYKERFKAEYYQLKIRLEKLSSVIVRHDANTLDFNLTCPVDLLKAQRRSMVEYLYSLEVRAEREKIDL